MDFNESLNALGKMSMSQEMRSAIKIQNLFRAKLAREELRKKKVQNGKGEPFRGWVTEHDRFSGKDYYWIEDSLDHAESGRKIGLKSIIMDHPYNKEWDGPRVKNWKQIYEIINDTTY